MIADSLPDLFGNLVFNEWIKANGKGNNKYVRRALSINGKRNGISTKDLLQFGDTCGIKNAKTIISNTFSSLSELKAELQGIGVGNVVVRGIVKSVSANLQDLQRLE